MHLVESLAYLIFRICFCLLDFGFASMIIFYLMTKMRYLHGNFRCLVFSNCASCFIVTVSLISFLCGQLADADDLIEYSTTCYFFGLYGDAFTTMFMIFERGIATLKAKHYEAQKMNILCSLVLFTLPFLAALLFMWLYNSRIIPLADVINSIFFAVIAFGCLVESILIYRYNQKALSSRHLTHLSLSARFQYAENFSLSKVFLFVTANDLLTWITLSILYYFASITEVGTLIESNGNIFLDLGDSVYLEKCFVLYTALYVSHQQFERRRRRIQPAPTVHLATKIYFDHLLKTWERFGSQGIT